MVLPDEPVSLAVRGTGNYQHSPDEYHIIARSLRVRAISSFQRQGGYLPGNAPETLTPRDKSATSDCVATKPLRDFHIIMRCYPQLIGEWVQAVCYAGKTIPDEYIPYLLKLGSEKNHLQKWLKLLMSDRAEWLIQNNSSIPGSDWYGLCRLVSVDDVAEQERHVFRKQGYQICATLAVEGFSDPRRDTASVLLRQYEPAWTDNIARFVLDAMLVSHVSGNNPANNALVDVMYMAAYRLPLKFSQEFIAELRSGHPGWYPVVDEIETIFALRHDMLRSILESGS